MGFQTVLANLQVESPDTCAAVKSWRAQSGDEGAQVTGQRITIGIRFVPNTK
jgi:hypothetical protein